ncbi:uncharacterized protein LOC131068015 [Cryptomeria japonica]|uniref:uncharacterized protein LOC131068015 n=1 Tax=Cryptomeria japonica TaxID=3369 RepID=UPI0027DA9BAE|nr:uncharacterized protein LOC131068015 [Cryptomeria japonica]
MEFAAPFTKVSHEKYLSTPFSEDMQKKKSSRRSKFFYSCGHSLFTITHFLCAKTKELPFPFGQLAANTEDTLGPWIQPVVGSVEGLGLNLLSIADYQLSLIGSVAEYISPSTSILFEKAQKIEDFSVKMPDMVIMTVDKLAVRGVAGSIADLWVKYEAELNGKTDIMLRMAEKVPFLSPIASVVNSAVSPFAGMVSDWMLKHSEVEVKEVPPDDTVAKSVTDGPIDDTVAKDVTDGPIDDSTHEAGNDSQFLERIEPSTKNHDASVSIEEQYSDNILQEDNETSEVTEEGIGMPVPLHFVETSPDPILELFDASWHMGSSVISPKTGPSPKKKAGK